MPFLAAPLTRYRRTAHPQKTSTECGYLLEGGVEGLGPLRHAALYHSADAARRRAVFCLLLPSAKRSVLQIVSPASNGPKEVRCPNSLGFLVSCRNILACRFPSN